MGATRSWLSVVAGLALAGAGLVPVGGPEVAAAAPVPAVAPSAPVVSEFSDVPVGAPFRLEIEWLASTGITTGWPDGTFHPSAPVERQAMAAFLYRFAGSPAFTPPSTASFSDVSSSHPFFLEIEWLASTGITTGYPDHTFHPSAPVERQAMAAFLYRLADMSRTVSVPVGSLTVLATPVVLTTVTNLVADRQVAGLDWSLTDGGGIALSASTTAATGPQQVTVTGTGCTGTRCGVGFRLVVDVQVTGIEASASAPVQTLVAPSADRVARATPVDVIDAKELVDEVSVVLGTAEAPGTRADADVVASAVGAVVAGGMQDIGIYQLRWTTPQDIDARITALGAMDGVAGVDRALMVADSAASTQLPPGDWSDDTAEATWPFTQMRTPQAWALSTGSSVPVGIVDVGLVDSHHPDLYVRESTNTTGATVHPHATHVAGLACARANGIGLVGAAWGCPIITDSVLNAFKANREDYDVSAAIAFSTAVSAARRVIEAGAKVVNMSLGFNLAGQCSDQVAADWLDVYLRDRVGGAASVFRRLATTVGKDVVFTLSAGNDCIPGVSSPFGAAADLDNVITVSAVNSDNKLARFSNWGGEVAAGGGVAVPSQTGVWSTLPGGIYGTDRGTSMAAPLVAGVAALVRAYHPDYSADQVGRCIVATAGTSTGYANVVDTYPTDFTPKVSGFTGGLPIVDAEAAVLCGDTGPAHLTTLVSAPLDGAPANGGSYEQPSVSADGRWITYVSGASNLAPGDTNGRGDVFLTDTTTGVTTLVSAATDGTQANGGIYGSPAISADGRWITYVSGASNLVPGDTNGAWDVFVTDRTTGGTTLVSAATDGTRANGWSIGPAISADGRWITYGSEASNLVPGDTNSTNDVFVTDRTTGVTSLVSADLDGSPGSNISNWPAISADGRWITYSSDASNLVAGDTNRVPDVFVTDRTTGATTLVSAAPGGTAANNQSYDAAISADGRWITYESFASNLVAGDTFMNQDVFLTDRTTGFTTVVSAPPGGTAANGGSDYPSVSADGRWITYSSNASNLVPGDTNNYSDVFVTDQTTGVTTLVSTALEGTPANSGSYNPYLSADGRWVAYYSYASNLVQGDTNQVPDVFVSSNPGMP